MKKKESARGAGFYALTLRERQLLYPLTEGKANRLIAEEMGLSRRTVESHRASIFHKMGVNNAVQLMHALYSNPRLYERMTAGEPRQPAKKTASRTSVTPPRRAR